MRTAQHSFLWSTFTAKLKTYAQETTDSPPVPQLPTCPSYKINQQKTRAKFLWQHARTSSMEASRSASLASPRTGLPSASVARRPASAAFGVYAKPAAANIFPVECGAAATDVRAERRFGVTSCVTDCSCQDEASYETAMMKWLLHRRQIVNCLELSR